MIVNIDNYVRKKLHNTKFGKMKNLEEKSMRTIYDFIHNNNISRNGILTKLTSGVINIKEQKGGEIFNIKLKDNKKYYYDIRQITSKRGNEHRICFVNIRDIKNNCLCFTYHSRETKITTLELNDLNATEDCIACDDKKHNFKIGDVLMQIFLELIKTNNEFTHIQTIELQDNSTKKCFGYGIQLKYLRTITDGIPYYAKYGFRPAYLEDIETFRYNRNLHRTNITLRNNILIKIFDKMKNESNMGAYNIYKKYIRNSLLEEKYVDPIIILKKLMNIEREKFDDIELTTEEKNRFCEIVNIKIKNIFNACGYRDYNVDKWILKIR
jgi:hypothetical protein